MGQDITPGHTYIDGELLTHTTLNEHVSEAVIKPTAISAKLLKDPATLGDEVLINDGGVLRKITLQQLYALIVGEGVTPDQMSEEARIPAGVIMDFAGETAPDGWLLCYGQLVLRATYERLFAAIGTTWGAGDGTTTFSIPDLRGQVTAGMDNMGGTAAGRLGSYIGATTLGGAGGLEYSALTQAEMPPHQHNVNSFGSGSGTATITSEIVRVTGGGIGGGGPYGTLNQAFAGTCSVSVSVFGTTDVRGSGGAFPNIQPTRIVNKIIRYA